MCKNEKYELLKDLPGLPKTTYSTDLVDWKFVLIWSWMWSSYIPKKWLKNKCFFRKIEEHILVPENIKISESGINYNRWISNWKQDLYFETTVRMWAVVEFNKSTPFKKYKLVKTPRMYISDWDMFVFESCKKNIWLNHVESYNIKTETIDWWFKYVSWTNSWWVSINNIVMCNRKDQLVYKVVPVE